MTGSSDISAHHARGGLPDDSEVAARPAWQLPSWPMADDNICGVFAAMLADGSWGRYHGSHCDALKSALAEFHHADHVHLCSSGTAAVELALLAVGVQSGDEVVLAAYDFKANYINVLTLGARPVLIDTTAAAPVMNPALLAEAITDRTKAVICSHLHGNLADIRSILQIAHQHGVQVIEDACQVPGAMIYGCRAGMLADVGVLSFGGSKLLTAGRGGAILTNRPEIAQRMKLYTQRGNDAYPLSEMQAAVLVPQLAALNGLNDRRFRNAQRLMAAVTLQSETAILQPFAFSNVSAGDSTAFYKLAFVVRNAASRDHLEQLSIIAREKGVALDPGFMAIHLIHSQRRMRIVGQLINSEKLHHRLLTLHHPALLLDDSEFDHVINAIVSLP